MLACAAYAYSVGRADCKVRCDACFLYSHGMLALSIASFSLKTQGGYISIPKEGGIALYKKWQEDSYRINRAVQRSAVCRSRRELSNAYLLAKFGFDRAENEPCEVCRIPRFSEAHCCSWEVLVGSRFAQIPNARQIWSYFTGLVLGCIETNFCE